MMRRLVDEAGFVDFGIYEDPIDEVNYKDYRLESPMGLPVPRALRAGLAKQFHFMGVMGPELMIGLAVVDLKYLANGFVYVYDRRKKTMHETRKLQRGGSGVFIEPFPDSGKSVFTSTSLTVEAQRGRIEARGEGFEISLRLDMAPTSPLRICTRAGYRGWSFTQKTAPVALEGRVTLHGETFELSSPDYLALTDWTCGFLRRETYWAWASTAFALPNGRNLGLNLACGVNETGFTENAFWLDSSMTKVDSVNFVFDRENLSRPWRITSYDGKVDLSFYPESQRGEKIAAMLISSRFTQMLGVFEGTLRTDDGEEIVLKDCPGFTEDHYAKW